jgi:hypothetical protein
MQLPLQLLLLLLLLMLLLVQMLHPLLGVKPWWGSCSSSWGPWRMLYLLMCSSWCSAHCA